MADYSDLVELKSRGLVELRGGDDGPVAWRITDVGEAWLQTPGEPKPGAEQLLTLLKLTDLGKLEHRWQGSQLMFRQV